MSAVRCKGQDDWLTRDQLAGLQTDDSVVVDTVVDFDTSSDIDLLCCLRMLRDAAAYRIPVEWIGRASESQDLSMITHLPPPGKPLSSNFTEWTYWKNGYFPGLMYLRKGPGFVIIQDRRLNQLKPRRVVIGDKRLISALVEVEQPIRATMVSDLAAIQKLQSADLVLQIRGHYLALPGRLGSWPIPAYSI